MGLQCIHHIWALLPHFIVIIFFSSSLLARIYCSLSFKVHKFLIILVLGIQQGGLRLGNFIRLCRMLDFKSIAYLLPYVQGPIFQKVFWFGLMIVIRLWSYEPFELKYTFRSWDKLVICENLFSFIQNVLRYAITFESFFNFIPFNLSFRIR